MQRQSFSGSYSYAIGTPACPAYAGLCGSFALLLTNKLHRTRTYGTQPFLYSKTGWCRAKQWRHSRRDFTDGAGANLLDLAPRVAEHF
ncbi:hypothetical protein HZH68_014454 [Vespula germanica]|uniref:Uncharacterized protein n=1 Tax=Vespula germanica TaxID=30212 RepID=A0A834JAM1_VESGE|nr:hypothetical protein HZH68_014454 [Vespula germanica]